MKKVIAALVSVLIFALFSVTTQAQEPNPNCNQPNKYVAGCQIPIGKLNLNIIRWNQALLLTWEQQPNAQIYYVWRMGPVKEVSQRDRGVPPQWYLIGYTTEPQYLDEAVGCGTVYVYFISVNASYNAAFNQMKTARSFCW